MSSSFFLSQSYGFSSGDINTGSAGNGWGTNSQTYFNVVDKIYGMNPTTGLVIDLYDTILMNPFERVDFLADVTYFNQNYIKVIQDSNLVYIIPNGPKILNDNFDLNSIIPLPVIINYNNVEYICTIQIGFVSDIIKPEYNLTYEFLNYKIPLTTLFAGCSTTDVSILETLKIKYINGIDPVTKNIPVELLVKDGHLNLEIISGIVDPEIVYTIDSNGIFETGTIRFINKIDGYKPETEVQDFQVTINPCNGQFIDIHEYSTGDKFGIELFEGGLVRPATNTFKINTVGQFISIIPNTAEIQKLDTIQTFNIKYMFATARTKGVFNLTIVVDPAKVVYPQSIIDSVVPNAGNKKIILSNGQLTFGKPLDISPLLSNRKFDPLNNFRIISVQGDQNVSFNNVDGPHIFNTGPVTGGVLTITYEFNNITYTSELQITKETRLYREPFEIIPINFNISPNYFNSVNIFDHIQIEASQYKNLKIEIDNPGNFTQATYPAELIAPFDTITTSTSGIIKVTNPTTFTNMSNTDGYNRPIGYREIPYYINVLSSPGPVDYIVTEDIIFYLDNLSVIETFDTALNMYHYLSNYSKITDVKLHSDTTADIIFGVAASNPTPDKLAILKTTNGLVFQYGSGTKPLPNTKVILEIEYLTNDGSKLTYFQTIKFLLKGI